MEMRTVWMLRPGSMCRMIGDRAYMPGEEISEDDPNFEELRPHVCGRKIGVINEGVDAVTIEPQAAAPVDDYDEHETEDDDSED